MSPSSPAMAETIIEMPRAAARKDECAPSGWGLWVDDFDGAEPDMRVHVTVHPRSGDPWPAEALLQKRVSNKDGTERWIAQNISQDDKPRPPASGTHQPDPGTDCHEAAATMAQRTVATIDERPLAEIIHDFTSVPGWVPRRMEIEVLNGKYHIELAFEHGSTLSDAPPDDDEPF